MTKYSNCSVVHSRRIDATHFFYLQEKARFSVRLAALVALAHPCATRHRYGPCTMQIIDMDVLMSRAHGRWSGPTSIARGQESGAIAAGATVAIARLLLLIALWPWMALCSEAQDVRELPASHTSFRLQTGTPHTVQLMNLG